MYELSSPLLRTAKVHAKLLIGARCNGGQGGGAALSTCLCIHAEENALLEAGRERIREGATLYCNTWDPPTRFCY